jgi:hypothetical protein
MKTPYLATTFLLVVAAVPALAQDTRADAIRALQAEKRQRLVPPSRNRAEVIIDRLEDWGLFMSEPRGFHPWFGSIFPGGGTGAGAGLREPFGDDGAFRARAGASIGGFWHAESDVALPTFARNRVRLTLSARLTHAPDVRHHGTGNDTLKADEAYFGYRPATVGARIDVGAHRYLTLSGGMTHLDVETSPGRTGPSIADRVDPGRAPRPNIGTNR